MAHPLDGARLKVDRARVHLESLKDTIDKYRKSDPYVISVERNPEGWGGQADITHHPDPQISAIIGDCLHNLRSALDYVMWEIAGTYAMKPLVPPRLGKDKVYFPLYATREAFRKTFSPVRKKYKIPGRVVVALKAVQPYKHGYERLALLDELSNVDKHRLPLIVLGRIDRFGISVSLRSDFPANLSSVPDDYEHKVETQATVYVRWQDPMMPREPVEQTIGDIVNCVAKVVPRFDDFVV